ncbi:MAG: hypothetical protein RLY58_732 [Pseudomonadota bacterium]|jgi:hypothetical protein
MSRTLQISLGWLLLPLVAWLGLQVYDLAMQPVLTWFIQHGLTRDVALLLALAGLGHAALFAWPLVKLYGRAAGLAAFIMVWPVLWAHVSPVFDVHVSRDLRLFWAFSLLMYGASLWLAVHVVSRPRRFARVARGPIPVDRLLRRHQRGVMQRLAAQSHAPLSNQPVKP